MGRRGWRLNREASGLMGAGTQQRFALIPQAPAIAESGVPGFEASTAFGVLAVKSAGIKVE
jgi:tripartite-type tricarboxylate transporter receptor subunit TctC